MLSNTLSFYSHKIIMVYNHLDQDLDYKLLLYFITFRTACIVMQAVKAMAVIGMVVATDATSESAMAVIGMVVATDATSENSTRNISVISTDLELSVRPPQHLDTHC